MRKLHLVVLASLALAVTVQAQTPSGAGAPSGLNANTGIDATNATAPVAGTTPNANVPLGAKQVTMRHNGTDITVNVSELDSHIAAGDTVVRFLDQSGTPINANTPVNAPPLDANVH